MTIIGIDPGVSGAVAILRDTEEIGIWDIPVVKVTRGKKLRTEFNAPECARLLREKCSTPDGTCMWLEMTQARPIGKSSGVCPQCKRPIGARDSLVSAHRIGMGIALWIGIAAALYIRCETVYPQQWKRKMGLIGQDKEGSRHKAIQLFPRLAEQLKFKKHHNRAEALLIAEYGRQK